MSIFTPTRLSCPKCGAENAFDAAESVNADRRPELRAAIADGSFQAAPCGACGSIYRMEPSFTYVELKAGHFIVVAPLTARDEVEKHEARALAAFDASYGAAAPPAVRRLVSNITPRVVFGWAALLEKLVIQQAGLDDVQVELAKALVLKEVPDAPLGAGVELRLLRVEDGQLVFVWLNTATDDIDDAIGLDLAAYEDIAADPEPWAPLRAELAAGPWVDLSRLMLEPV